MLSELVDVKPEDNEVPKEIGAVVWHRRELHPRLKMALECLEEG